MKVAPRRRRIGPQAILKVEAISTGKEVGLKSDLDGEDIPQPHVRPPKWQFAQDYADDINRRRQHRDKALLEWVGVMPKPQGLVAPKIEGKVPVGELKTKDGTRLSLQIPPTPKPKWRRI